MSHRLPPLNTLRTFEAAARSGSFTAAAHQLCVTHSAVSRQIRALEAALGVPLFERTGRRVRLTTDGTHYLRAVQDAFDLLGAATQRLTARAAGGRLVVNCVPTVSMHWLLPRLTRFQQRHPAVELRLATGGPDFDPLAVEFDVAIRRDEGSWPDCIAEPFLVERAAPVCSPALLARQPLARPEDLARHTLLHAETRPDAWVRWLRAAGQPEALAVSRAQYYDFFYLALQAAIDGLGVVLGPLPMLEDELASGRLVAPLPGPVIEARRYCWVVRRRRAPEPLVQAFCAWLREEADHGGAGPA